MATNANRAITAFAAGAEWAAHPTVSTLATAMDVGDPSNMERIFHLFGGYEPARAELRAERVDDDEIRRVIREGEARWGTVWDPHTATAVAARERLGGEDWIVVATAHPAKFEGVVEPLVGHEVDDITFHAIAQWGSRPSCGACSTAPRAPSRSSPPCTPSAPRSKVTETETQSTSS